jgi:hypothetical protein
MKNWKGAPPNERRSSRTKGKVFGKPNLSGL